MRRSPLLRSAFVLVTVAAVPLLVGCGDDPAADGGDRSTTATASGDPSAADTGSEAATEGAARPRVPRSAKTSKVELPDAPPLADTEAGAILEELTGDLAGDEISRSLLLYLHDLGRTEGLDAVREQLLAQTDGEYDDEEAAALGLEIELLHGDEEAAQRIIQLAELLVEDEFAGPAIAQALGRIDGTLRGRAEELMVQIAAGDDDEAAQIAVEELARRRSNAPAEILPTLVTDDERYEWLRGTALAAMAAIDHPELATATDQLLGAEDVDLSEVIYGLAIPGLEEAVPLVERAMAVALEEGAADFEFAAAAEALSTIYGPGSGSARAKELITTWLTADDSMAGDESVVALWELGDEGQSAFVARVLEGEVARASYIDTEFAVDILEELARRGLARDPRYRKAIDAAAISATDPGRPGTNLNVSAIRAAAAYAYLKSR